MVIIIMFVIIRLELIWVNRDYTGLDWFLHLLKTAESCPIVNIMVRVDQNTKSQISKSGESCLFVNIKVCLIRKLNLKLGKVSEKKPFLGL